MVSADRLGKEIRCAAANTSYGQPVPCSHPAIVLLRRLPASNNTGGTWCAGPEP